MGADRDAGASRRCRDPLRWSAPKLWEHLKRPFYDNGPNDQRGLGIQLAFSIGARQRRAICSRAVRDPDRFSDRHVALMNTKALDPFHIQVLKARSSRQAPRLDAASRASTHIKDSSLSSIFVIFICLAVADDDQNPPAFGVGLGGGANGSMWAKTAGRSATFRRAFHPSFLPAAAPTILTGNAHLHRHCLGW